MSALIWLASLRDLGWRRRRFGSGKTTLLSCLAAILSPTGGSIAFGDTDIAALAGKERTRFRRHTVGIASQAFNLVPSLTATDALGSPERARADATPSTPTRSPVR